MNNKTKKLLIISLAPTILKAGKYWSYSPYVNEMDLWFKYADQQRILSPFTYPEEVLMKPFGTKTIERYYIPFFAFNSFFNILKAIVFMPFIVFQMIRAMAWADHIHLRCPANVSLIACFVQILFPWKEKSTKYAGNWDPNSNQPVAYRMQQAILRHPFFTRNMKVLVYGDWPGETSNIHPFISATYYDTEKVPFIPKNYTQELVFVFAGMLVPGKRPLLTIQFIEQLNARGIPARLELFGDGPLMADVRAYITAHSLEEQITVHGNQDKTVVKAALLKAHFNILLSKSEGWPKAVAEGMFYGCLPVTTAVSCVSWMVGEGQRGIIVEPSLEQAVDHFIVVFTASDLNIMAEAALNWSQLYTYNRMEADIKSVLEGTFVSRV
ncbi:glycosyltransferase family 4 protein [Formosa algae]|uniref:Glycosyltransferase involved in cell wall biosynthesis n=1 Tax=Formosa algae TaxID=225843 RepID=A0A9X0YPK1_9FLAO|nr:glycosyltransferase [Formosa algae]MBP1841334.1 glycosyltransferase involved in cell wall biosynthesis [Formosa algae]MDQ0336744.1 glycosyltransferase involved in cell wall biosynthesis [Formosa algae]